MAPGSAMLAPFAFMKIGGIDSVKRIRRALISVSDKTGIVDFARALDARGIEILSTGGTARALSDAGLTVRDVASVTGFPEILNGRVKTLHPAIHGGILAIRDDEAHAEQLSEHDIATIDLVVVNLYPFEATVAREDVASHEAIENIDIGGPSMIRSAAKNFSDVAVVVDPGDYRRVLDEIEVHDGVVSEATRLDLARKAFETTAHYDSAIADFLVNRLSVADESSDLVVSESEILPVRLSITLERLQSLRYGENPHQRAALYVQDSPTGIAGATKIQGKELSYNNLLDLDAAWSLVLEFPDDIACVIIKHTNPCGAATGSSTKEAYARALATDPTSAFGSIIAFNRDVDGPTADAMADMFVEVVVAPGYTEEALERFGRKKNLRVMRISPDEELGGRQFDLRPIAGGLLLQERDEGRVQLEDLRIVTARKPKFDETRALLFAWTIVKHVKSNAIVYAGDGQLIGVGAGQMSRVDSVRIGAEKAKLPLKGSVLASDAFFPFRDGIDTAAQHGVTAVIQPGGSVRDDEVIAAADEHGLAMVFTGMRHFRH